MCPAHLPVCACLHACWPGHVHRRIGAPPGLVHPPPFPSAPYPRGAPYPLSSHRLPAALPCAQTPDHLKTETGVEAFNPNGLAQRSIALLKVRAAVARHGGGCALRRVKRYVALR